MKRWLSLVLVISVAVLLPLNLQAQDGSGVRCRRLSGESRPRPKCKIQQADLDRFADYVIAQIGKDSAGNNDALLQVAGKLKQSDGQKLIRTELEDRICDSDERAKENKFRDLETEMSGLLRPENLQDYRRELSGNAQLAARKCPWFLCSVFRRCCS